MFNPIEEKQRFVQAQIQKSFDSGIDVNEEIELEKATYVNNSENRKLGRVGQEYGGSLHNKGSQPKFKPTSQLSMTIDAIDDFLEASKAFNKMKPNDSGYAEQKKKLLSAAKLADATGDNLSNDELKALKREHPQHAEALKTIFRMSSAIKAEYAELEKAHKDGDIHPKHPNWVWVSSAAGGKGDWRIAGGRAHKKAGASTSETATGSKVDITKIPDAEFKRITQMLEKKNPDHRDAERNLEEEAMSDKELKNFYAVAEHFKNSSNINKLTQEYCRKWAELAKQEMQYRKKSKSSTTPAPRKPGSTNEIERMTTIAVRNVILGLNNIATNVKDNGDHFKIDFDANDFNTNGKRSPQIDRIAKFLESMGASCVIGSNSIKAYKKVEAKKDTTSKTQLPQDKVKDIMQQFDDTTMDEDEFDEYVDSVLGNDMGQKFRKEILESNKSFSDKKQAYKDAVERHLGLKPQKYSDMEIRDAKKALVGKVVTLKDYWPDGRGGSQDAVGEIKNVRLYGKDRLPIAEISYPNGDEQQIRLDEIDDGKLKDSYKTPITIGDDQTKLDAVKKKRYNLEPDGTPVDLSKIDNNNLKFSIALVKTNIRDLKNKLSQTSKTALVARKRLNAQIEDQEGKLSEMEEEMNKRVNSKSDPRDKIAQDAGFKDYEEMKGYQDYVTQKNFLKKPSTKAGMRLLYKQEVDKYEKNHADVITKIEKRRKTNVGNFSGMKLTEILDSLDNWGDNEWNNKSLNEKLTSAISTAIKSEKIDENEFNKIAKKYQGLDLVYTDYADLDDETKVKRATSDFAKLLQPLDNWSDNDWNDKQKNLKLENDIKMVIRKNRLSEKQFKEIAKQYQGLDLSYTDFVPKNSSEYKKFN